MAMASSVTLLAIFCCQFGKKTAKCLLMGIKDAQRFDADVKGRAVIQLFHYFDRTFFDLWPDDMKKLLLSMADFPSFDRELDLRWRRFWSNMPTLWQRTIPIMRSSIENCNFTADLALNDSKTKVFT
jgi:hypothetical protein